LIFESFGKFSKGLIPFLLILALITEGEGRENEEEEDDDDDDDDDDGDAEEEGVNTLSKLNPLNVTLSALPES